MKILNISNNDYDGAGKAVLRLNESFINLGHKSKFLVLYKKTSNKNISPVSTGKSLRELIKFILSSTFRVNKKTYYDFFILLRTKIYQVINNFRYRPNNLYNFYNIPFNFEHLHPHIIEADIVILHSIQDMLTVEDIGRIYHIFKKQIVLHPLDMEMITGGYHFSFDCNCYRTGKCNSKNHNMSLLAKKNYKKKVKILENIPCIWVASNRYVFNRIKNSKIYSNKNHLASVIYFSTENCRYNYYIKKNARKKLKINSEKEILLFGCSDFSDPRKGFDIINSVLDKLNRSEFNLKKLLLLTFGETNNVKVNNGSIEWMHLGTINSAKKINLVYRAADIMLSPSLDDLGPTTVQEAFLNDLYIISFELGLACDLIIDNYNGNIVKNFDSDKFYTALYKKINKISKMKKNKQSIEKVNLMKDLCSGESEAQNFLSKISG